MQFLIYRITNTVTGGVYIGQTTMGLSQRMSAHLSEARRLKHDFPLYRAIRKHGEGAFVATIVAKCKDRIAMNAREHFEISALKSAGANCYNAHPGGLKGYPISPETRAKMSASRLGQRHHQFGKPLSAEHKKSLSASHRGKVCSEETRAKLRAASTGKTFSPETRAKISASKRGQKMPAHVLSALQAANAARPSHLRKAVRCVETGVVYESSRLAALAAGVSPASMCRHTNGRQTLSIGLTFEKV